jgi:RNA polymerase sigma-70 factor (ECF subfamily)
MKISEKNFLKQLRRRDEKALLYVIDQYGGLLHSIVGKHLYTTHDGQEECLNDIFYAIWENIESYNEEKSSFKNWIAGIARYKSIDYLRKYLKTAGRHINLEEWVSAGEKACEQQVDDGFLSVEEKHFSKEMEQMLGLLKPSDQELFLKHFFEEKNLDEISREMGVKKDILYNHISRGKQRIRKHYPKGKGVSL